MNSLSKNQESQEENPSTNYGPASVSPSSFVDCAVRCHALGWRLAVVDAEELVDLEVDFAEEPEVWTSHLDALASFRGRLQLGVYTGKASRLLILEMQPGSGEAVLNRYGAWRSPCRTRVASGREQHYYSLPSAGPIIPTCFLSAPQVMVFGENGLALVPPSLDVQTQEAWAWLTPPWECLPPEASPDFLAFLQEYLPQEPGCEEEPEILAWNEVYRLIAPHEQVLQAFLSPSSSPEKYYHGLLQAAMEAGLRDQALILGLFWHGPQGDSQYRSKFWAQLQGMVKEALHDSSKKGSSPGHAEEPPPTTGTSGARKSIGHDNIFDELSSLNDKAAELKNLLAQWRQNVAPGSIPSLTAQITTPQTFPDRSFGRLPESGQMEKKAAKADRPGERRQGHENLATALPNDAAPGNQNRGEMRLSYAELPRKAPTGPSYQALQATFSACLENNPDLAGDPFKVQMVHYCFKNYVNIDPDLVDLSLQERVERASQMAREFLGNFR